MIEVDILLATYNGAKYLDSQILSILSQTFQKWRLIIHDDGSSDHTVDIIKRYAKFDERIVFVEDGYAVHDPGRHFIHMLQFSTSAYVCFCDQDDIWFEYKLEKMLNRIVVLDNTKPQVIFSDAYLYYTNDQRIGGKLLVTQPCGLKEVLFINGGIHGSASIFNEKMRGHLQCAIPGFSIMHDHILTLIGCTYGEVSYVNEKLFLYRQHSGNVTGNIEVRPIRRIINAFRSVSSKYVLSFNTVRAVRAFSEIYGEKLCKDDRALLSRYIRLVHIHPVLRLFQIICDGYSLNGSRVRLWIKVLTRHFLAGG